MDFFPAVPQPQDDDAAEEGAASPPRNTGGDGKSGWSFSGLIKSIASKSEMVIQIYRRDLQDFASGLKKETAVLREAAASSLKIGASAAQVSLDSFGQAFDDSVSEIIAHGKDAFLSTDAAETNLNRLSSSSSSSFGNQIDPSKRYSRWETQLLAIQSDAKSFSEELEDSKDFERWKTEFDLGKEEEEIDKLCYKNGRVKGFLIKLVPGVVDYETFWCRYYYRVHKLKQAEDARSKLVKRVMARNEEELSWEVDDRDEEEELKSTRKEFNEPPDEIKEFAEVVKVEILSSNNEMASTGGKITNAWLVDKAVIFEPENDAVSESTAEVAVPFKDGDSSSTVFGHPSSEQEGQEDDLEWDEIEDLGEQEDKEIRDSSVRGKLPGSDHLRKKLSAVEEDEDLSWDIEEEDD